MADFEGLLQNTLTSINLRFAEAERDFTAVIEKLSEAIKKSSNSDFALSTSIISDGQKGSVYRLYFDIDTQNMDSDLQALDTFYISSKGYPIQQGQYRKAIDDFIARNEFSNIEQLESYFETMLADPESPLIQSIGFGLRRKERAARDNEIPF